MRGWWRQLPPSGNPSRIVPLPYPWARNRGKPTNVSSWQVPTAICCGTKPATKGIITGFILRRCPFPIGCNALDWLKEIGYQVGTGIMVGSPYQTVDHLVEDILFIERFQPEMIGMGPFLPHHDTPFSSFPPGDMELTLKLLSIFRLMHPAALIPATTALATLAPDGRERGILAGANVVMPNLSPSHQRAKYSLYDNKASAGAEAAEGLLKLEEQLKGIGYEVSRERGDYENGELTVDN